MSELPEKTTWLPPYVPRVVWLVYVVLWTRALLMPNPINPDDHEQLREHLFYFGKSVHVAAYGLFAILSAWLYVPFRYRWLLLAEEFPVG